MDFSSRDVRIGSTTRGVFIAALIAVYAWLEPQSQSSWPVSILIAAILQIAVIAIRRFVPAGALPAVLYVFEMIADGISVLLFALGVFGGIARFSAEA
jgi:hypothetical protein